jgi:sulfide:quinone oxidoreductase
MSLTEHPLRVVVAGGGIAALELMLALRALAGARVEVTLLTAAPLLTPRAMSVAEPFERGGAQSYEWTQIAHDQHADVVFDKLVAVDTDARVAHTHDGRRLRYDVLALATGARRVEPFTGALTFGTREDDPARMRALVAGLVGRGDGDIAFALPAPSIWPLPIYELALLSAAELREHGCAARVRIVTPEEHPLELFGPAARDAVVPMFEALGIELVAGAQPREVIGGALRLEGGGSVAADHVVTLADVVARPVPGLPVDRAGFLPVDLHGLVAGVSGVFAAGEATAFPLRQGGLATQQADAVAEAIAASCGADIVPSPFSPVLRGRLLTAGAPLYLQARPSGQSLASTHALWSPPEKIAGRYLAPYLASARPSRLGASPLAERVPVAATRAGSGSDAVALARWIAHAEARCANRMRALQAFEAARTLAGDGADPADDELARRVAAEVPAS